MVNIRIFLVLGCGFIVSVWSFPLPSGFGGEFGSSSYKGPTSYATSFLSEFPGSGNFGNIDVRSPPISSSYSSYGPTGSNEFTSTSYTNYPPSTSYTSSHIPSELLSSSPHFPPTSYSSFSSGSPPATSYGIPVSGLGSLNTPAAHSPDTATPISQHIEVTRPIAIPVFKKFPYPVNKKFRVPIPHPVLVPVPAPFPVHIPIAVPEAIPILKEIKVPVEKEVMYPVEKKVPVTVEKPVKFEVEKLYPVYVSNPYPVKIPIVKTIVHKAKPNGW